MTTGMIKRIDPSLNAEINHLITAIYSTTGIKLKFPAASAIYAKVNKQHVLNFRIGNDVIEVRKRE